MCHDIMVDLRRICVVDINGNGGIYDSDSWKTTQSNFLTKAILHADTKNQTWNTVMETQSLTIWAN